MLMSSRGGFPHPLSPPRARRPARRPRALARGHLRGRETQRDRERARPPPSSRRPPPRRAIRTGLPESEPAAATATALTAANRHRGARRERRGGMSEAGEATTGGTTLPQAAADAPAAAPPDPAPKSPAASGAPQAPAPAALLAGSPGGDAAPGPAPASSAPAGSEDAEKKVLGESLAAARERRRARMDVDAGRAGTRGPGLGSLCCGSGKPHVSSRGGWDSGEGQEGWFGKTLLCGVFFPPWPGSVRCLSPTPFPRGLGTAAMLLRAICRHRDVATPGETWGGHPPPLVSTAAKSLPVSTNCCTFSSPAPWEHTYRAGKNLVGSRTSVQNMVTIRLVTGRETGRWGLEILGDRGFATVAVVFCHIFECPHLP